MIDKDTQAKRLCLLHDEMVADSTNWNDHYEDVLQYVAPHKNRVYNDTQGEKRGQRLYDTSAQHFVELLSSALHSMLTNPAVHWAGLSTGDLELDAKTNVKKYIQKLVAQIHEYLANTNFQTEVHEFYMDLTSIGTGATFIDRDEEDVLRFLTTPIFELNVRENHRGIIDTVSKIIKLSPNQAILKYGEEAFGERLAELKQRGNEQKLEILHIVEPREGRDKSKKDKLNKPFASYHIWKEHKMILKEDGYDKNPWIVARWTKLGNESRGRSPAMKTLPQIKLLNSMMKAVIRGAQKAIDPPMIIGHDSVLGRMNLAAGGISAVRQGMADSIKPIQSGARVDLGMDIIEMVRANIKQGFFIDQLQLGGSDRMTELEVNIRNDENLRLLSPILGRLHSEFLEPMIGRIMEILINDNKIPEEVPAELDGVTLKVYYRSQIAKAQRSNEGRSIANYVAEITQLSQALQKPEVMDVINLDKVAMIKADLDSIDIRIFNDTEEIEETREGRAQMQAEAQAMQQQGMEAQIGEMEAKAAKV